VGCYPPGQEQGARPPRPCGTTDRTHARTRPAGAPATPQPRNCPPHVLTPAAHARTAPSPPRACNCARCNSFGCLPIARSLPRPAAPAGGAAGMASPAVEEAAPRAPGEAFALISAQRSYLRGGRRRARQQRRFACEARESSCEIPFPPLPCRGTAGAARLAGAVPGGRLPGAPRAAREHTGGGGQGKQGASAPRQRGRAGGQGRDAQVRAGGGRAAGPSFAPTHPRRKHARWPDARARPCSQAAAIGGAQLGAAQRVPDRTGPGNAPRARGGCTLDAGVREGASRPRCIGLACALAGAASP
jgi:hypothetical protein